MLYSLTISTFLCLLLLPSRIWGYATSQTGNNLSFNEVRFENLIETIEEDIIAFAKEVERLYTEYRCDEETLIKCSKSNYDHCISELPNPVCLNGIQYGVSACGDMCGGLYTYEKTIIRMPQALIGEDGINPTDPSVIESICFSDRIADFWMNKVESDSAYWDFLGVQPDGYYFGSASGIFRTYPGKYASTCNKYDPRIRPWYAAASSGPKNVVLILDISANMKTGKRLELMKIAVQHIIKTLTVGDRVAIVTTGGNDNKSNIFAAENDNTFHTATSVNKKMLSTKIDEEINEASGESDFATAFNTAFDIFDKSSEIGNNVDCNNAILFFSYGVNDATDTSSDDGTTTNEQVLEAIQTRISQFNNNNANDTAATTTNFGIASQEETILSPFFALLEDTYYDTIDNTKPLLFFTYTLSEEEEIHNSFPSDLACTVDNGIWSKITSEETAISSLYSYYNAFATGLGVNEQYIAWVEPYEYFSNNLFGTTVSAPVYDRSYNPPIFLGVVGIDFSLAALDAALGIVNEDGGDSAESIKRAVAKSTQTCPKLGLSDCTIESFRQREGQQCSASKCSSSDLLPPIKPETCTNVDKSIYPTDIWENTNTLGLEYTDRVCCMIGENKVSDQCPLNATNIDTSESVLLINCSPAKVVFTTLIATTLLIYMSY